MWTSLFSIALTYPEHPGLTDQHHYKRYFTELQYVLPCRKCKRHYSRIFRHYPINPFLREGRRGLFHWLVNVHNRINRDMGTPEMTEQQVLAKYLPDLRSGNIPQQHLQIGGMLNGETALSLTTLGLVGIVLYLRRT